MAAKLPSIDDFFDDVPPPVPAGRHSNPQISRPPTTAVPTLRPLTVNDRQQLSYPINNRFGSSTRNAELFANHQPLAQQYPFNIYRASPMRMPYNAHQGFSRNRYNYQPVARRQVWNCDACMRHFFEESDYQEHLTQHIKCPHKQCKYEAHVNIVIKHFELQHLTGLFERIGKLETPEEIAQWRELRKKRFPKLRPTQICEESANCSNTPSTRISDDANRATSSQPQHKRVICDDDEEAEDGELTSSDEDEARIVDKLTTESAKLEVNKANLLNKYDETHLRDVLDYFASSNNNGRRSFGRGRGNYAQPNNRKKLSLRDKLVQADLRKDFDIIKSVGIHNREQLDACLKSRKIVSENDVQ